VTTNLVDDLLSPDRTLIETHTAWVFLEQDRVYKVKKPVNFGFLDFTSPEQRRAACEAELELNARLAPQVYRQVVPITRGPSGKLRFGGEGQALDYAVEMDRLSDEWRADLRLERGELNVADIDAIAEWIAAFHAKMPADAETSAFGKPEVLCENIKENFAQTRESVREHLSDDEAREIEDRQLGFIETHRALLEERMTAGRVRDGHGDLRLEHVYLTEGKPVIIDCIEFNTRFRFADVCADIAFLAMDLERLGRVDLAERLLATYARAAGDYELYRLVDFYEGYRAYVRGKVATLLAADRDASAETRAKAAKDARRYYLLALSAGRAPLIGASVVAIGGIIASGKSTVADRLGLLMSAPVVDADHTRKSIVGVAPLEALEGAPWAGAYAPAVTEAVYTELARRAEAVLASGRPVILDASFRTRALRAMARDLATRHDLPFYFLEVEASPEICRERLRKRAEGPSVSDARVDLYDEFVSKWESVDELSPAEHIVVNTDGNLETLLQRLSRRLPSWPPGLTQ
jgi:uncharacterized protein